MMRREERIERRIRKRKAELQLVSGPGGSDAILESDTLAIECLAPSEKARALSEELKKVLQQKEPSYDLEFLLTLEKLNGRWIGERELSNYFHYSLFGSGSIQKPFWFRFKNGRRALQNVIIRINCLDEHLLDENGEYTFINAFFKRSWIQLNNSLGDRRRFWKSMSTVNLSRNCILRQKILERIDSLMEYRGSDLKLELLVDFDQMVESEFPFPSSMVDNSQNGDDIFPTKQTYKKVTKSSPIFVIDCEMCLTSANCLELTRITMMNEGAEILIDSLVKPKNEIVDYITHKSGITKQLLEGVTVRLRDIQKQISDILTEDAIICGHSIENDLRALKMFHPFCIDISLHYNFGSPKARTALRTLSRIYLDEIIQDSKNGHCSQEDALATLKLLKLKLENGVLFGNVFLGWNFREWASKNGLDSYGRRILSEDDTKFEHQTCQVTKSGESQNILSAAHERSYSDESLKNGQTEDPEAKNPFLLIQREENFNLSDIIPQSQGPRMDAKLCNYLATTKKKVLIAMENPEEFFQLAQNCKMIDLCQEKAPFETIPSRIACELIKYDACLIEANCLASSISRAQIDKFLRGLCQGICNNGLIFVTFSGRSKSIMYVKLKKSKDHVFI